MNPPVPPPPPPQYTEPVFGDPTAHRRESQRALGKGIGCGCGGCTMVVLAVVGFIVLVFGGILWGIGRSDATALIIQTAQQNAELQAEIGTPMTASPWVTGNYKDINGVGSADVTITLTGPKGKAEVSAKASRPKGGQWQVDEAKAKVQDTGKSIQLVAPAAHRVVAALT